MSEEFYLMDVGNDNVSNVSSGADEGALVFNLDEVEESKGFELLPKGTYTAIVDEMEFGDSSAGNPMITTKYKIVDPEFEGRVLYDYWVMKGNGSEFGLAKVKKFMVRVCPDISVSAFNPEEFCEGGEAIGRELRLKVVIKTQKKGEYKGEKRNQVQDILSPENDSFL